MDSNKIFCIKETFRFWIFQFFLSLSHSHREKQPLPRMPPERVFECLLFQAWKVNVKYLLYIEFVFTYWQKVFGTDWTESISHIFARKNHFKLTHSIQLPQGIKHQSIPLNEISRLGNPARDVIDVHSRWMFYLFGNTHYKINSTFQTFCGVNSTKICTFDEPNWKSQCECLLSKKIKCVYEYAYFYISMNCGFSRALHEKWANFSNEKKTERIISRYSVEKTFRSIFFLSPNNKQCRNGTMMTTTATNTTSRRYASIKVPE